MRTVYKNLVTNLLSMEWTQAIVVSPEIAFFVLSFVITCFGCFFLPKYALCEIHFFLQNLTDWLMIEHYASIVNRHR